MICLDLIKSDQVLSGFPDEIEGRRLYVGYRIHYSKWIRPILVYFLRDLDKK